ncbi:MAG TPA: sugar ABC transporter ATP-binding protein [Chthoniobacterales bacterium]|nr:sugar ABC transporter ATP-binding protein [Chthoniobacterales bacterium]
MSTSTKAGLSDDRPILEVRGITKSFPGVRALKNVDLRIWPGEVHALMGENGAGKSTLMKILAGAYRPDSGAIFLDGNPVQFRTPHEARLAGIGIIYQELTVAPNLTVSGNVFLGSELSRLGFIKDTEEMDRRTQGVLDRLGARFRPNQRAARLAVAEQQQVEIARALFYKSRVLVMDEPTAALSDRETDRLFEVVRHLRSEGLAIIYISHRMAEVYELADRLSVLRDGEYVGELKRAEFSAAKVIEMMVGRRLEDFYEHTKRAARGVVLEVKEMSDRDRVKNASFQLRQGEVLGLAGLVGAGRTELARLIFGADKRKSGEVYLNGEKLQINQPKDAIRAGIGYVPEDRKLQGVFLQMSSGENITMNILGGCSAWGVLNFKKLNDRANAEVKAMRVRTASLKSRAGGLSGGNQQKLLLARWLEINPKVLLLDEPTRGVDVGAKAEIYALIQQLVDKGTAVLFISSELPEIVGVCDRVLVMREGEITGEVGGETGIEITQQNIMQLATDVSRSGPTNGN